MFQTISSEYLTKPDQLSILDCCDFWFLYPFAYVVLYFINVCFSVFHVNCVYLWIVFHCSIQDADVLDNLLEFWVVFSSDLLHSRYCLLSSPGHHWWQILPFKRRRILRILSMYFIKLLCCSLHWLSRHCSFEGYLIFSFQFFCHIWTSDWSEFYLDFFPASCFSVSYFTSPSFMYLILFSLLLGIALSLFRWPLIGSSGCIFLSRSFLLVCFWGNSIFSLEPFPFLSFPNSLVFCRILVHIYLISSLNPYILF